MSSLDSGFMLALFHDSGHSCVDRNKFHAFYITGVNISEESFHIQNRISSRPVAVFFKFTRALQTSLSIRQFGHLHALCNLYVDRMHAVLIIAELPKIIIRAVQRLFIQSSVSKVRHWEMKSTFFYHLQLPRILVRGVSPVVADYQQTLLFDLFYQTYYCCIQHKWID